MRKIFFGFAVADSMLPQNCSVKKYSYSVSQIKELQRDGVEITPCLNPSHQATISAMKEKFGLNIEIPATPPQVALQDGDSLIVMGVRGLPRLTDRHEYTSEEIAGASFTFSMYEVTV